MSATRYVPPLPDLRAMIAPSSASSKFMVGFGAPPPVFPLSLSKRSRWEGGLGVELARSLLQDDDRRHLIKLAGRDASNPICQRLHALEFPIRDREIHAAEYCPRECGRIWNDQCEFVAAVFVDNMPESMFRLVEIIYTANNGKVSSLERKMVALFSGQIHRIQR